MKILIELPTWLGDAVMTSPAIESLVSLYPNSEIIFLGSHNSIQLFKFHPNSIRLVELNRSLLSIYTFAKCLGIFDMFVSFRSSKRATLMKYFVNAELKFIFDKRIYSHGHQVERYMGFINESFNVDLNAGPLKIHIPKKLSSIKKPILGINPGASYGSAKRWYPDRFAISASKLSDQFDIFIYGGPEDSEIVNDIKNKLDELNVKNYKILAGEMSVAELVISISKLDLFITADSGPMHIASAFKIPSICLFGPTKDSETSQWMNSESIILKANLECQPCMKKTCPLKHHNCMKAISSEDVVKNSLNLLGQVKIN